MLSRKNGGWNEFLLERMEGREKVREKKARKKYARKQRRERGKI